MGLSTTDRLSSSIVIVTSDMMTRNARRARSGLGEG